MQTAEVLHKEYKPETRPQSNQAALGFQQPHLSVSYLYINICKCNVTCFCPLSLTYHTALTGPRASVADNQPTG